MTDQTNKILALMAEVGVLEKGSKNSHFGYNYLSEFDTKLAVQKAFIKHGIMHEGIELEVLASEQTSSGRYCEVRCTITMPGRDAQKDSDNIFASVYRYQGLGSGIDKTDKALLKAQTAAVREALKNLLIIPAGHDPENDQDDDTEQPRASKPATQPATPSKADWKCLLDRQEQLGLTKDEVGGMVKHYFSKPSSQFTYQEYEELMAILLGMQKQDVPTVRAGDYSQMGEYLKLGAIGGNDA